MSTRRCLTWFSQKLSCTLLSQALAPSMPQARVADLKPASPLSPTTLASLASPLSPTTLTSLASALSPTTLGLLLEDITTTVASQGRSKSMAPPVTPHLAAI